MYSVSVCVYTCNPNDPSIDSVKKQKNCVLLRVFHQPTNPPNAQPMLPFIFGAFSRRQGAVMLGFTTVAKCFSRSFQVVSAVSPPILRVPKSPRVGERHVFHTHHWIFLLGSVIP